MLPGEHGSERADSAVMVGEGPGNSVAYASMRPQDSTAKTFGEFLRSRRNVLDPTKLEMFDGTARRVPGLRREEIAALAGLSPSYYTRIEQGSVRVPSADIVEALATAMLLDDDERAYLCRLAGFQPRRGRVSPAARLDPALSALLSSLSAPAGVLGHDLTVLGWNRLAHKVFASHLSFDAPQDGTVNWIRTVLVDAESRALFQNWRDVAEDIVGRLRVACAHHPGDSGLAGLVSSMRQESDEFATLWSSHCVRSRPLGGVDLNHPEVGELRLTDTVLHLPQNPGQLLLVFHPNDHPDTEHKLRMLASNVDRPWSQAAAE
ncbi:helix-turn-helix transcriptional regulator [Nocardia wallacei]|uniref:helix-turn-helix transcriptional regulator n=2 Tax=Nocardia wallacei TaxID=480035 RepID=UPI002457259B|nr:helix-turn-helix transcriptional regulator [Nocardia wallacei]